jgi:hypothetical protein
MAVDRDRQQVISCERATKSPHLRRSVGWNQKLEKMMKSSNRRDFSAVLVVRLAAHPLRAQTSEDGDSDEEIRWKRSADALTIQLSKNTPNVPVAGFKITPTEK